MKLKHSIPLAFLIASMPAHAIFVDGEGHYALRGETRTKPGFSGETGQYQAINQFFRLNTELRVSDQASFFAEVSLFDDERSALVGDTSSPILCNDNTDAAEPTKSGSDCAGAQQSAIEPRYQSLSPSITKAYAKYSMDYCLLTFGRRDRHWGLGMYLDAGNDIFDTDASVYDGVTCDINIQKSQTLGFSVGYDKISESGASPFTVDNPTESYGAANKSDDLDQIFFTIEYNDHKLNSGSGFSQQIGIYFANIFGGDNTQTDIKIADLYVNFLLSDLVIQNEFLFRLGESSDPNLKFLGGARGRSEANKNKNDVQSIAMTGSIEYFLSRSGSAVGPKKYQRGNVKSHSLFFDYAIAPGDKHGYLDEYASVGDTDPLRDQSVKAIAFHRNFKPALLLFNGNPGTDNLRVDGIFDPTRVMNATVFSLGYRYKSFENGDFEAKVITASLNETMDDETKATYDASADEAVPVGYAGNSLGTEIDLTYTRSLGKGLEFGFSAAFAQPGDAWKTKKSQSLEANYLIQSHLSFEF